MKEVDCECVFNALCDELLMMNYSFWDVINEHRHLLPQFKLLRDNSEFNFVDGEESDNGVIKYYYDKTVFIEGFLNGMTEEHKERMFICRHINFGGDEASWEFSEFGIKLFKPYVMRCIETAYSELLNAQIVLTSEGKPIASS